MRRLMGFTALAFLGLLFSSPAFAQDGDSTVYYALGSGLAIGLAAFGAALGQGLSSGKALEGMARNPTSKSEVFFPMILALALMEFQALLGFTVAFLWYAK